MITTGDLTCKGRGTGSVPGSQPTDLALFGDITSAINQIFQGAWSSQQFYYLGQWVTRLTGSPTGGGIYKAIKDNINLAPESNASAGGSAWQLILQAAPGAAGASSYTYIAYANDASGEGFTMTFNSSLGYIAILTTTAPITSPVAANFAGLWKNYTGPQGTAGTAGTPGTNAYVYVGYASDASGDGFSTVPASGLGYVAFLTSSVVISDLSAAHFAGLWQQFVGAAGEAGTNGTNGANAYVYVAYASDASGDGFTLTFNSALPFMAILLTDTAISEPTAANFAGLWKNYTGPAGPNGTNGNNGTNAYVYVAYASDASGTGFTMTFSTALDYIAVLSTTTALTSPTAANFAGLWKNYGAASFAVSGAITFMGGTLSLNAASANTANYLVQRDASGNFAANLISLGGTTSAANHITFASAGTMGFINGGFAFNAGITATALAISNYEFQISNGTLELACTVSGTTSVVAGYDGTALTVYALKLANQSAGFVQCDSSGNITAGAATTDNLAEGTTNFYFTTARVLATTLAGLNSSAGGAISTTDNILSSMGKIQNRLANLESNTLTNVTLSPPLTLGNFKVDGSGNVLLQWPDATWHRIVMTISQGQYVWDINQSPN